jgi:hypothetical protein
MMMMMATGTYERKEPGTSSKVVNGKRGNCKTRDGDRFALMPEYQHKQMNTTHPKKTLLKKTNIGQCPVSINNCL